MISVMNNDFDLERSQTSASEAEEPRVSNDGVNERDGDLNLNPEIRVWSGNELGVQENDNDEGTVLPGPVQEGDDARASHANCSLNGDSGNSVGCEDSSGDDDPDIDIEIDFRVQDREPRDVQNEVEIPEAGEAGVVSDGDDGIGKRENLGSTSDPGNVHDDTSGKSAVCNSEAVHINGIDGEFRLQRHSKSQASVSSNVRVGDADVITRAGVMKVLGSQFEIGDTVWGKVKSHPWWPGHIYNEAFASSSVQRTRRDGLVLVAFFGDSSYGWFDPTELVPYEPYYAEKSQQMYSKNFMRAVEESVDEASRRSALGLNCRCRKPNNFRPANVPGYIAVDVVDYDPGAIYSVNQIQKARESFRPAKTLSFIKPLAVSPRSSESKSLDFIKQKATALAYRRSICEEFDETYAQAFGHQSVPLSQWPPTLTDKEPSRAPLSGPLVFAETICGRKNSTKATKSKEQSKKDRYLFNYRDEAGETRMTLISQVHAGSSSSSAYEDGTSDSAAASYVFQKRDQAVLVNDEMADTPATDQTGTSAHAATAKDASIAGLNVNINMDASGKRVPFDACNGLLQSESSALDTTTKVSEASQVPDSQVSRVASAHPGHIDMSGDLVKKKKKKKKAAKRPAEEQSAEKSGLPKKKKKKMKKLDGERSMEHPARLSSASAAVYAVKPAVGPMQIPISCGEDSETSHWKKDEVSNTVPQQIESMQLDVAELPQMLADLHGLALDPFHGAERNRPAIVCQFFLKSRSLVFLKSGIASSPTESEPSESRATRPNPLAESAEESSKTVPPLKLSKLSVRHKDPTKRGKKRVPSVCQEEIATKRAKKITEVKSLGAEKKALLKNPELQRTDGKVKVSGAQQSPLKPMKAQQHTKRVDCPPRVEKPTYLVMKFQSGSSLPSLVELKARFARFGRLDTSRSRVFYKTNTCRVAFLYKQDANVAYRYAVGNKSVFSNVKFMLNPVGAPETQQPSSTRAEVFHGEPASNWDSPAIEPRPAVPPPAPLMQQQAQQLRSCLKKPSGGDESGALSRAAWVRFKIGEDKGGATSNNRGVVGIQVLPMESRNALQSSSEGCPSSSSSVAMDVVNNNNQRFISSHPLQLPAPPQFHRPPLNHPQHHDVEVASRNNFNYNLSATNGPLGALPPPPPPPHSSANTDISQQMMSLLTRCHDVVTSVKSILGYVPYHPLRQ